MSLQPLDPAKDAANGAVEEDNVCTQEHCFHAFDTLYCALTRATPVAPQFPDDKYPLFVTWNTRSKPSRPPRLRGCIGTFEPHAVHEGLKEYAIISAFQDSRFNRIEERELPFLECAISLLTDFEDVTSYLDWTVGVHGIYISFDQPKSFFASLTGSGSGAPSPLSSSSSLPATRFNSRKMYTATYLPEVAEDQGWNKIEAVDSAIRKAGWDGRITEDLRRSIKLRRYQSRKCSVTWAQFVEWRSENGDAVEFE